jgi:hypothetical protein
MSILSMSFIKKVHSLDVKTSTKNYVLSSFFPFLWHEANIGGGGKTVHVVFKYLSISLL